MARPKKPPVVEDESFDENDPPIRVHGWESWPQIREAAAMLGVAERTLLRRVLRGDFPRTRCPDGVYRYDPTDLEAEIASSEPEDSTAVKHPSAQLLEQATRQLQASQGHIERLVNLFEAPILKFMSQAGDENKHLRARITELEDKVIDQVEVREELVSQAHERQIAMHLAISAEERKDKAVHILTTQIGPALIQGMRKASKSVEPPAVTTSAEPAAPPPVPSTDTEPDPELLAMLKKLEVLKAFSSSLDPAMRAMLTSEESPWLDEVQKQQLTEILG